MSEEYTYDYDHTRCQLNTNVIDHRPSLLRSTRQMMDRSPSPTFYRSPKLPVQEIYRSLMQNGPDMNIDKVLLKQKLLENLSNPKNESKSIGAESKPSTNNNSEVQKKCTEKGIPSAYRQKTCDGCASKRQFNVEESKTGENNNNIVTRSRPSSASGRNSRVSNHMYKPSWRFCRLNSAGASNHSSIYEPTPSVSSSARMSHWSSGTRRGPGSESASSPRDLITSSPTTARTDSSTQSRNRSKTPLNLKPETLKKIFIVNGSVVSFNGYGFESFTNWFGDETMLRSDSHKVKAIVHKELDMSGFTNQEINMKLYDGNKLVIEASRLLRGRYPAMRFKETIVLPKGLSVESLIVCRTKSGRLVIEDITRPYSQSSTAET